MALPGQDIATSHQVRLGEATAIALSTGASKFYPIYRGDRKVEVKQVGFFIGNTTVQDDGAPATSYIVAELWNQTDSTKIAKATILGQAIATQILPNSFVTIATEAGIDDLGNQEVAENDVLALKFIFTNAGGSKGLPYPVSHLKFAVLE